MDENLRKLMSMEDRLSKVESTIRMIFANLGESDRETLSKIARESWATSEPNTKLTWKEEMDGKPFVSLLTKHCGTDFESVLEIGPGYGRILKSFADQADTRSYLGLDISPNNIAFLKELELPFAATFENADFITANINQDFDLIYSAAVWLHFFPDISEALGRSRDLLRSGGRLCFDVGIGTKSWFHNTGGFVKQYQQSELVDLIEKSGLRVVTVEKYDYFSPVAAGFFCACEKP